MVTVSPSVKLRLLSSGAPGAASCLIITAVVADSPNCPVVMK